MVGAGNSGAQILAEVSAPGAASSALWSTLEEPSFLPMGLSGKEIFDTGERGRERERKWEPKNKAWRLHAHKTRPIRTIYIFSSRKTRNGTSSSNGTRAKKCTVLGGLFRVWVDRPSFDTSGVFALSLSFSLFSLKPPFPPTFSPPFLVSCFCIISRWTTHGDKKRHYLLCSAST